MTLFAHTDGASRGNPGESGIGIIFRDELGNVLFSGGGYIGKATNNIAEYQALLACLRKAMTIRRANSSTSSPEVHRQTQNGRPRSGGGRFRF